MSNKLFSMLELAFKGFPHNRFYALDFEGVSPDVVPAFLQDGLRNFRSLVDCRFVSVRTGLANKPEVKLFLAPNLDASDDELILSKMKEALVFFSKKFGGYRDCFIILQEWTPEEDYLYSLNLLSLNDSFVVEAAKGNHSLIGRDGVPPTVIKFGSSGNELLKDGLGPDDLVLLQRHLNQLFSNHFFEDNCVYEFSFLQDGLTFYQIKRPGELYKHPISKQEFYNKLNEKGIPFQSKILRKNVL